MVGIYNKNISLSFSRVLKSNEIEWHDNYIRCKTWYEDILMLIELYEME